MVLASDVKEGGAILFDGKLCRVLEAVRHTGSGQMHGFIELKLKDLRHGHVTEHRFKHTDKLETIDLVKRPMDFLYSTPQECYFMDPETFLQVGIPKTAIGQTEQFLTEGTRATVEMLGEEAITISLPKVMELQVASTGPGIRDGQDNTLKAALLENGVEIHVPQFINTGDLIRIDTEKIRYIDRVLMKK